MAFLTSVYSAFGESEVPPNNFATCSYRLHVIACCSVLLSILGNDPTHNARTPSSVTILTNDVDGRPSCTLVRSTSGGCVRNVATPPATAPAKKVSIASVSRPCATATSPITVLICVYITRLRPENGASLSSVEPSPENSPFIPSFAPMVYRALATPVYVVPLIDAYSILVLTTVRGQSMAAARALDAAPTAKVLAPCTVWEESFDTGNFALSSLVTLSRSRKYSPAPHAVRTHDADTPAHSPRIPSSLTTHPAVAHALLLMEKPAFSLCACILVFTTSSGCRAPLETRPAVDPAMNDVALLPTVPIGGLIFTSAFFCFPFPMASGSGGGRHCEKHWTYRRAFGLADATFCMRRFEITRGRAIPGEMAEEAKTTVAVKWQGKQFSVSVPDDADVACLKRCIEAETNVLPSRQKLLNVKSGPKPADDDVLLSSVKLPKVVMMMGSTEQSIATVAKAAEAAPEVVDDFDVGVNEEVDCRDREENQAKLRKRIDTYKVDGLNPPREGKKLLVLDIDYTLFDHRSTAEVPEELMRPYLHEFLTQAYQEYDIVIWSATGMKWIEVKMRELGVLGSPNFKIMQLVDHGAMITVQTEKYGMFDCKPLGWLWAKYEQYSEKNTIMFDDLRRNFVMNPQNGLKIRPFRKAHLNRDTDRELVGLTKYLLAIAKLEVRVARFDPTDAFQFILLTLHTPSPLAGCPIHGAEPLQVGKVHRGEVRNT